MTSNYTRVRITTPYDAWQYPGGEIPEDVQALMIEHGAYHIGHESESDAAKRQAERREAFAKAGVTDPIPPWEPNESATWYTSGGSQSVWPGGYIVFTEAGPIGMDADELEVVNDAAE